MDTISNVFESLYALDSKGRFSLKQDDVIHQWNTRKDLRAIPGDIPLHMNVNLVILIAFLLWVIIY